MKVKRIYRNRYDELVSEEVLYVAEDSPIGEILNSDFFKVRSKAITFHREDGETVYWQPLEEKEGE